VRRASPARILFRTLQAAPFYYTLVPRDFERTVVSMQKELPAWLRPALLVVAILLIAFGALAWSNEARIQSATLFSFGLLLILQWHVLRTRPGRSNPKAS
jgi:uncharacterized membrane protein YhhN